MRAGACAADAALRLTGVRTLDPHVRATQRAWLRPTVPPRPATHLVEVIRLPVVRLVLNPHVVESNTLIIVVAGRAVVATAAVVVVAVA